MQAGGSRGPNPGPGLIDRGYLRTNGSMEVVVGDCSMGFLIEAGDPDDSDSHDQVIEEGSGDVEWTSSRGAPFSLQRERMHVSPRDGYAFCGIVADDGRHDLSAVYSLEYGHDVLGGPHRLNADVSVPPRVLAVFCDEAGDAVCADGFRLPGLFAGTDYQKDAEECGERFYRHRLSASAADELDVHMAAQAHPDLDVDGLLVCRRTAGGIGWFACAAGVFAFLIGGSDAGWLPLRAASPFVAVALQAVALFYSRRYAARCRELARNRGVSARVAPIAERTARRSVRRGVVGLAVCAIACAAIASPAVLDLGEGPKPVSVTFEGPRPGELSDQAKAHDEDSDESAPTAHFKDASGRDYSLEVDASDIDQLSAGGLGDEFVLRVYPRTGAVEGLAE